jgi:hypothetical protein
MVLGSGIRDPRLGIRKKPILDPGSRGKKGTGSRIPDPGSRIRNTVHYEHFLKISEGSDKKIIIVTNGLKPVIKNSTGPAKPHAL